MPKVDSIVTVLSSTVLRLSAYVFLRWIPGHHFPPLIYGALCVYLAAFYRCYRAVVPLEIVRDDIHVIVKEVSAQEKSLAKEGLMEGAEDGPLKELDVVEDVVLLPKPVRPLRTLISGLPSPSSQGYSILTMLINILLALMATDLVYRGPMLYPSHDLVFARAGYVSYDSAKILVRDPDPTHFPLELTFRQIEASHDDTLSETTFDDDWSHVGTVNFAQDLSVGTDYTATSIIEGLKPETRYEYSWSNGQSGYFVTAPVPGRTSKRYDNIYTFLHSSCIKPQVPYNPIKHPLHIPGLVKLASWLPELKAQFMLFLGDFIYVDVPHRFGVDIETYRSEYRRMYASPDWPAVSSSRENPLPWIHVWDDHEIANDWDKNSTGLYQAAADPFQHYQIGPNPPPVRPAATWFTFIQGPAAFFLMDTRSYRSPESSNAVDPTKSMLGQAQAVDLLHWIREPVPAGVKWKFIVSSIPFTKNWRFGDKDTWGTYLIERQLILEAAWETSSTLGIGIVVLSGDRHEFAATRFPPPATSLWPDSAAVHEFSTSPLSMFYLPIRTYKQLDDEDVTIKYLPDGNSKFGAIDIRTPEQSDNSILQYRLFIEGKESWGYTITSPQAA